MYPMIITAFQRLALPAVMSLVFATTCLAAKYAGEPFHLDDVTSGFWNPAGLAAVESKEFAFMHSETFGDLLNHDYIAFAMPLGPAEQRRAVAVTVTRLGGGGIKLTEWDSRIHRPVVIKEDSHADYQLLLSYAPYSSSKFLLGASAKFIYRDIAENTAYGLGADLGVQYIASDQLKAGIMFRDVTTSMLSYDTGTKESIYPTVIPGIGYSRGVGEFDFTIAADAEVKFENYRESAQFWQGSISADSRIGAELGFRNTVFGRAGSDMGRLSLGGGIAVSSFEFDIAYLRYQDIDDSFRLSVAYRLN
jgi:hypothetical protein